MLAESEVRRRAFGRERVLLLPRLSDAGSRGQRFQRGSSAVTVFELKATVRQSVKVVGRTMFCCRCSEWKEIASYSDELLQKSLIKLDALFSQIHISCLSPSRVFKPTQSIIASTAQYATNQSRLMVMIYGWRLSAFAKWFSTNGTLTILSFYHVLKLIRGDSISHPSFTTSPDSPFVTLLQIFEIPFVVR